MSVGELLASKVLCDEEKRKTGVKPVLPRRIQLRLSEKEYHLFEELAWRLRNASEGKQTSDYLLKHLHRAVYRVGLDFISKLTPVYAVKTLKMVLSVDKPQSKGGRPKK